MKRPLVPVVLALMVGLTAAACGVQIPGGWLAAGLAALLVIMLLLFWATPSGPKNPPRDSPKTADLPAKEKDHR